MNSHDDLAMDFLDIHVVLTTMHCCVGPHQRCFVGRWLQMADHLVIGCRWGSTCEIVGVLCRLLDRINWILLDRSCLHHRISLLLSDWRWVDRVVSAGSLLGLLVHNSVSALPLLIKRRNSSEVLRVGEFWRGSQVSDTIQNRLRRLWVVLLVKTGLGFLSNFLWRGWKSRRLLEWLWMLIVLVLM